MFLSLLDRKVEERITLLQNNNCDKDNADVDWQNIHQIIKAKCRSNEWYDFGEICMVSGLVRVGERASRRIKAINLL